MTERYVIVAFNPDGTQDFLEWDNDFDKLWKLKNEYQRKEREEWKKDGGEYKLLEVIEFAPKKKELVDK